MKRQDYFKMGDLIDAYNGLLTVKQRSFLELYYFNNYSIEEIAERKMITKQGVYDLLKRAEKRLVNYEEKLGLLKIRHRFLANQKLALSLDKFKIKFITKVKTSAQTDFASSIERIKKKLTSV